MSGFRPSGAWIFQTRIGWIVGMGVLLLIFGLLVRTWVFDRHTLTIRIETANVPVTCRRSSKSFFGRTKAERDFEPEDSARAYCGWVWSDHGPFGLPHSNAMPLVQTDRATLINAFRPGCRYKVTVVGTGARPTILPNRERNAGTIIRIVEALPCM